MLAKCEIQPASCWNSGDLAILADMATRRLSSFLWSFVGSEGMSPFEIGRSVIHADQASTLHHSKWLVALSGTDVMGAVNSYPLSEAHVTPPTGPSARVLDPLNELKTMAVGTWYVAAVAVFPEARGRGIGAELLRSTKLAARAASIDTITLMVGSFNPCARDLYERLGFEKKAERAFVPFRGSDPEGAWVLMTKSIIGNAR